MKGSKSFIFTKSMIEDVRLIEYPRDQKSDHENESALMYSKSEKGQAY